MLSRTWRIWAKALGPKAVDDNREADGIAVIRTLILMTYLVTNVVICAGVARHWNDANCSVDLSTEADQGRQDSHHHIDRP